MTRRSAESISSPKKSLGRKEKLEALRKANQAMMKVWKRISQRTRNDVQDHV